MVDESDKGGVAEGADDSSVKKDEKPPVPAVVPIAVPVPPTTPQTPATPQTTAGPQEVVVRIAAGPPAAPPPPDPTQEAHNRKVDWWARVGVPITAAFVTGVVAFLAGMGACATAYFQTDVRTKVWEATHQDKERVLKTQSDLLKLQEDYLGKVKQIGEERDAVRKATETIQKKEADVEALKQQHARALDALRGQYGHLQAIENARVAKANADKVAVARRAPWKNHGCRTLQLITYRPLCDRGFRAVFAPDTPDQHEVVAALPTCAKAYVPWGEEGKAYERCVTYAQSFLAAKGLQKDDIDAIIGPFHLSDIVSRLRRNDDAVDQALKEK